MIYDVIIIGMGPAGVSAAIYLKMAGLNILTIDGGPFGGTLNYIDKIDNYPGLYNISGPDLALQMFNHIKKLDINFINEKVLNIVLDKKIKIVETKNNKYKCNNVIIAVGRIPKKLGLKDEELLLGKGISTCALCDGNFYKGKKVAVVGGGASALGEALYLANICEKVYLIHHSKAFSIKSEIVEEVLNKNNVECLMNSKITELISRDGKLSGVVVNEHVIEVEGLFTYIGFEPKVPFARSLGILDENGYVNVNDSYQTVIDGVYAIGDVIKKDLYQIVTAVSDGANVASKIIKKS